MFIEVFELWFKPDSTLSKMNQPKRKIGRPAKYMTVDNTAQLTEGTQGSSKGQDRDAYGVTGKIANYLSLYCCSDNN